MMRAIKLTVTCAVTLLGAGCGFFESSLLKACEEALKKRLAAPSAYERIAYFESTKPISDEDYIRHKTRYASPELKEADIRDFAARRGNPTIYVVDIEYDAPNAFGTPIRSSAICEYISASQPEKVFYLSVYLNGLTHSEWTHKLQAEELNRKLGRN